MEETTAAWLAALIDGEGSVMLNRRTYSGNTDSTKPRGRGVHYRPVVVVAANTDYRLMEAIASKLGDGQVYEHAVSNTANSYNPRKRRQWTYRLNVTQIREHMSHVRPWLVLKGEQYDLLAEALDIKTQLTPGNQGFLPVNRGVLQDRMDLIYTQIRGLNTRGREAPNTEEGDAK